MQPPITQPSGIRCRESRMIQATTGEATEISSRSGRGLGRPLSRPQRTPPRKASTQPDQVRMTLSDGAARFAGPQPYIAAAIGKGASAPMAIAQSAGGVESWPMADSGGSLAIQSLRNADEAAQPAASAKAIAARPYDHGLRCAQR